MKKLYDIEFPKFKKGDRVYIAGGYGKGIVEELMFSAAPEYLYLCSNESPDSPCSFWESNLKKLEKYEGNKLQEPT